MSRTVAVLLGTVLALAGVLWTLQGLGYVGGSPMTGVTLWAVVGPLVAFGGLALAALGGRRQGGDGP